MATDRPGRVALVHDFLVSMRGADRVFCEMARMWPDAPIFTTIYDERGTHGRFAGRDVRTSFLQRLHPTARSFRALLPLYPAAVESLDLRGHDVIVSSSSAWAHAVICDPGAVHVSYCHNPFRYVWSEREATLAARNPLVRAPLSGLFRRWRQWDWIAAQRVTRFVTNSVTTRSRIRAYFGRDSHIVHPPVELDRFSPGQPGDHYLVVTELVAHKQVRIAVEAFNRLRLPLVIVGGGPESRALRRIAGPTVRFAGRASDAEVARLMASARALVVTSVEEFGIAAVEAQAAGRPVIARAEGGALETVADGETGVLWRGDAEALAETVAAFDPASIDAAACVASAARFAPERFRERLRAEVEAARDGPPAETVEPVRRFARRQLALGPLVHRGPGGSQRTR